MAARFRVGLTGGIGSGKTAISDKLQELGVTVVDADVTARQVVEPGTEALKEIAQRYGADILLEDGHLNRGALRKIVFEDATERKWLESLTHPLIAERIEADLRAAQSEYAILASPLLLEGSQKDFVDHVVVVDVPEQMQLDRAMARDSNSEVLVRGIMAAQLARTERLEHADTVIDNSGDLPTLREKVENLHRKLLEQARKHAARAATGG